MAKRAGDTKDAASVVVAVDKDKSSQLALKWAVDNALGKGQHLTLLHIKIRPSSALLPYIYFIPTLKTLG